MPAVAGLIGSNSGRFNNLELSGIGRNGDEAAASKFREKFEKIVEDGNTRKTNHQL
jgi:hypothetical protein